MLPTWRPMRDVRRSVKTVRTATLQQVESRSGNWNSACAVDRARNSAANRTSAAFKADRRDQDTRDPVRQPPDRRRPGDLRSRLLHGAGGHRVEADGCAVWQRAVEGVPQGE